MAHYSYKAKDHSGTPVEGVVEANDPSTAARAVQSLGYLPISIQETTKTILQSSTGNKRRFNFELGFQRQPKMKLQELLLFSRELSDLVASGMTIGRALHTLSSRKDTSNVQQIITTLRD